MLSKKLLPTDFTLPRTLLVFSLAAFLIKGIDYARLGSYLPISICLVYIGLLFAGLKLSQGFFKFMVIFWCTALIGWGLIRLLLAGIIHFTSGIDEVHVRTQFGPWGIAISVLFMVMGIYLFIKRAWRTAGS